MLDSLGVDSVAELFKKIPNSLRLDRSLKIAPGQSELELLNDMEILSEENLNNWHLGYFLGAGAYSHFIPSAVDAIASRSEFYTAYTPYQPEISQGTLQTIFEWQTMMCGLTGCEVTNASMYDGASAAAEAALMAIRITGRKRVGLSRALHPNYRQVVETYLSGLDVEIFLIDLDKGTTSSIEICDKNTACVLIQQPNFHRRPTGPRERYTGGRSLATAHSLATNLIHFNRDKGAERQRLRQLAGITYRYTPMVSISPPDGLLLEVMGSLKLFGGLNKLHKRLFHLFQQLDHRTQFGFAHTPLAALVLAKSNTKTDLPDYPNKVVNQNIVERSLRNVPLMHTEIGPAIIERLANMGLFNLGAPLALPSHEIGKRFGTDLLTYLDKLTGKTADPRQPETPDQRFQSSLHLLQPVLDKETLLFPMQRLARELQGWLRARQLGVTRLQWEFQPLSGKSLTLPVNFAASRSNAKSILGNAMTK